MGTPFDPYRVLGLAPGASLLEIARARRRLAKRFHPDVASGDRAMERMRQINAAWDMLSDPHARRAWQHAAGRAAAYQSPRRNSESRTWTDWTYGTAPQRTAAPRADATSGRAGWIAVAAISLLLALIVVGGLVAALDGPSDLVRDSPVLQDNLDTHD